jgi:hypothetical protein
VRERGQLAPAIIAVKVSSLREPGPTAHCESENSFKETFFMKHCDVCQKMSPAQNFKLVLGLCAFFAKKVFKIFNVSEYSLL